MVAGFPLGARDLERARGLLQERGTIAVMREFMKKEELTPTGRHHEIYIADPRRVPPDKLKTILRRPVSGAC